MNAALLELLFSTGLKMAVRAIEDHAGKAFDQLTPGELQKSLEATVIRPANELIAEGEAQG
jgi:hypothetical protein